MGNKKILVKIKKIGKVEGSKSQNIDIGAVYIGLFSREPNIKERFNVGPISFRPSLRGLSTSLVQEIIDEKTFRTYNSIYEWQVFEEDPAEVLKHPYHYYFN